VCLAESRTLIGGHLLEMQGVFQVALLAGGAPLCALAVAGGVLARVRRCRARKVAPNGEEDLSISVELLALERERRVALRLQVRRRQNRHSVETRRLSRAQTLRQPLAGNLQNQLSHAFVGVDEARARTR
jgi:hypothetical protein